MTPCPHLSICPFAEMRPPTRGVYEFSTPSLLPRLGRRFNQAVAPITQPVVNVTQSAAPSGPLNPGERTYRPLDIQSDVIAVWALASRAALPLGPTMILAGLCLKWPQLWYVWSGGIIVCVALDAFYIIINRDVFIEGLTGKRFTTRERDPDATPTTDTNTIHVKAELKEGKRTLYDEFDISDYEAWHEFCRAVHEDGRNFSQNESERNNVPENDWKTVSKEWKRRKWLIPAKRRGTPELRARGRAWVKAYAMTAPEVDR